MISCVSGLYPRIVHPMTPRLTPEQQAALKLDMARAMHPFRLEEGLWRQLVQLAAELSVRTGDQVSVNGLIRDTLIRAYGLVVPGNTSEWRERSELLQATLEGRARMGLIDALGNDPTVQAVAEHRRAALDRKAKAD
jgi:hypothetical protein